MTRAIAAERTAEVLKAKVWALYNGDAQTPLQRQLARLERRQAETERRRELSNVRAAELLRHTLALEGEVSERTQDVRRILDHVRSGFLLIGEDLVVRPGFTKSCHRLLSTSEVAGRYLPDLLRVSGSREVEHLVHSFTQLFADILPEEMSADAIPTRYSIEDKAISLEVSVVRGKLGVEAVLLTINDITSLEEARRKVFANEVLIGVLTQRPAFRSFLAEARALLASAREAVGRDAEPIVRRCLHTIKGNAAAFSLVDVVALVHEIESAPSVSARDVDAVEARLRAFLADNAAILDISFDAVDDEDIGVLERSEHAVTPLRHYTEKLAERLEKDIEVSVLGGHVMIDAHYLRPLLQSLTHVVRNAVDHGIETTGRVTVEISEERDRWCLAIADDGRGINPDRLVEAATERGLITREASAILSESEKLALVFVDGLSTRDDVTEHSGRGVGMAAVKAAAEKLGAEIRIESRLGAGTHFAFSIPKPDARTGLLSRHSVDERTCG